MFIPFKLQEFQLLPFITLLLYHDTIVLPAPPDTQAPLPSFFVLFPYIVSVDNAINLSCIMRMAD